MKTKVCKQCNKEKDLNQFYKIRKISEKTYYRSYCKSCEYIRLRNWVSNNKNKYKLIQRKCKLKNSFKLSEEQFVNLINDQDNLCAVCRINIPTQIDHDHSCCLKIPTCGNCIRGVVCKRCNILLGYLETDKNILQLALIYLYKKERNNR